MINQLNRKSIELLRLAKNNEVKIKLEKKKSLDKLYIPKYSLNFLLTREQNDKVYRNDDSE